MSIWISESLENLNIKVFETISGEYRVVVAFQGIPDEEPWMSVFGKNYPALATAILVAERFAPTQEFKLRLWRKYNAIPAYLKNLANAAL